MERRPLSKRTRFEVFKRDGFKCCYCGQKPPEVVLVVDHVVPVAEGGQDDYDNLATSCWDCNAGKGAVGLGDAAPAFDEEAILTAIQEMGERRILLNQHLAGAEAFRRDVEQATDAAEARWAEIIGRGDCRSFERRSIATFLRRGLTLGDILAAMNIVDNRCGEGSKIHIMWLSFCKVCWDTIRNTRGNN